MTRFLLTLESRSGAGIHSLRAILKELLRWHGFRCIDAREIPPSAERAPDASPAQHEDQIKQREYDHEQSNRE